MGQNVNRFGQADQICYAAAERVQIRALVDMDGHKERPQQRQGSQSALAQSFMAELAISFRTFQTDDELTNKETSNILKEQR